MDYFPEKGRAWQRQTPAAAGIDEQLLGEAIAYSQDPAHSGSPADLGTHLVQQNTLKHDDGVTLGYIDRDKFVRVLAGVS